MMPVFHIENMVLQKGTNSPANFQQFVKGVFVFLLGNEFSISLSNPHTFLLKFFQGSLYFLTCPRLFDIIH